MAGLAIDGLEVIQKPTKIGGAKAEASLEAIDSRHVASGVRTQARDTVVLMDVRWNGVKVFSATKPDERNQLGARMTEWIAAHPRVVARILVAKDVELVARLHQERITYTLESLDRTLVRVISYDEAQVFAARRRVSHIRAWHRSLRPDRESSEASDHRNSMQAELRAPWQALRRDQILRRWFAARSHDDKAARHRAKLFAARARVDHAHEQMKVLGDAAAVVSHTRSTDRIGRGVG